MNMMRRLLLLCCLLVAMNASALVLYGPTFMELAVGETGAAEARIVQGFGSAPLETTAVFFAEPAGIVTVTGAIRPPETSARVEIHALATGTATIYALIDGRRGPMGTVRVYACETLRLTSPRTVYTAAPGERLPITVTASGGIPIAWEWFRGRTGDESEWLTGGDVLYFESQIVGTHHFWVRAKDRCGSTATIELQVVVGHPKRRAVRR